MDVWKCKVTGKHLKQLAEQSGMKMEEFSSLSQDALMGQDARAADEGGTSFVYEFRPDDEPCFFLWKKKVADGMFFTLGKLQMEKVPYENVGDALTGLLSECVVQLKQLKQEVQTSKAENFRFQTERDEAMQLYRGLVDEKAALEDVLISKFVCLLNAKKQKLAELQQQISSELNTEAIPEASAPHEKDKSRRKSPRRRRSTSRKGNRKRGTRRSERRTSSSSNTPSPHHLSKASRLRSSEELTDEEERVSSSENENTNDHEPEVPVNEEESSSPKVLHDIFAKMN